MSATKKEKNPVATESANARKREGALIAGARRTEAFRDKWVEAMRLIEQEVISNRGVYPHIGGSLTPAEVARRAGVIVNSVYHPRHEALKIEVQSFVDRMLALAPSEVPEDKQAQPTWEDMYIALVTNCRLDALSWQAEKALREAAERRAAELEKVVARYADTIAQLRRQIPDLSMGQPFGLVPDELN